MKKKMKIKHLSGTLILLLSFIFVSPFAFAQQTTINGLVSDNNGEPLPGVTIVVKGTTTGTVTDGNGNFILRLPPGANNLQFSFVGMQTQEIAVDGRSSFKVVLEEETIGLEEVVAVGYGTMKRSSVTGSISKVDAERIEGFPSVNVIDAMQGQAAGVYINPSRQPGESPSIRIRGSRSLSAGNDPLVIIDGMPGSWDNIVSQDIASMEILKDAAATAIYGSRAANGVILITTKTAARDQNKINIEVNSYAGFNHYDFIKMQSAEKYAELIRDVMRYQTHGAMDKNLWENSPIDTKRGMEMFHSTWATNYYDKGVDFDWQKALFNENSFNQGHNISFSNRTQKLAYRVTYNFQENNSYYKTVNFQRHVLNINSNLDLTEWINLGLISRLSMRQFSGWPDNMWDNLRRMSPFETPYVDEDPLNGLKDAVGKEMYVNALWNYEPGNLLDERNGHMADIIFKTDIKPFDWLTITGNYKFDFHTRQHGIYRDSKTSYQNLGLNFASMEKSSDVDFTWNGILNIDKTFNESHKFLGTAVVEAIKDSYEEIGASAQDIPASYMGYHFLKTGIINRDIWSSYRMSSLLSYMFRGQYEYEGRYLLNVAIRRDGSSRLAPENRWRNFPSFSTAWVVSEEDFMEKQKFFTSLKYRISYGEVGNQAISAYQTMTTLSQSTYNWGNEGIYTWQPSGIANKMLGWEVSKTWNTGLDFNIHNGKLSGSIELYHTTNEDLLMQRRLPEATGFSNIWQNIGETVNKGYEFTLSSNLLSGKKVRWSITGLLSRNWNEITELTEGKDDVGNQWFIGQPIGVVWDFKKTGIWQIPEADEAQKYNMQPGEIKLIDRDGDFAFTNDDKFILGQREPKIIGSFQNNFSWGGLDFSFNIVGQFGHLITASNYTAEWNADKYIIDAIDWWTPLNPTNEWPRAHTAQAHKYSSTLNIFDGDFIKIQNISLGYDLTNALSVFNLQKLRLYLQASNPFYLYKACPTDVNPEQPNTMYTIPASYVLGVNINL
ncbi:MAG TPA: SusC/RagA family TonB-linked outer membrane protein [Mariniphaga sp.]|nr:SusC/RagA family TonB-linked outer membrane protein [Mariniphaga sp.]